MGGKPRIKPDPLHAEAQLYRAAKLLTAATLALEAHKTGTHEEQLEWAQRAMRHAAIVYATSRGCEVPKELRPRK